MAFALEAATQGGRSTLAYFQTPFEVESKADQSPVTIADKGAERLIRELIEARFPGESILGEEEGGDASAPNRWVIDPIDGTKSFVAGVPLYSTLLSYEVDFEPVLGVVFFPALNEILYAERGSGAFLNGRPVRVSERTELQGSILCVGGHKTLHQSGRSHGFERLAEKALATRTWCDAYGHMLVASGRVDAMIDPVVSRWDLSALGVIIPEAGGKFTQFDGGPVLTDDKILEAISSNGQLHEAILQAFVS